MSASAGKLHDAADSASTRAVSGRTRVALTSPLLAYSAAAAGSVAVWIGVFKLIFG